MFGFVVKQDGDRTFDIDLGAKLAAETVRAAGWRANGEYYAFIGYLRDRGKAPVDPGAHDKARADRQLIECYLSFGSFQDFRRLS